MKTAGLLWLALAGAAIADTDLGALTPAERAAFHTEVRALLLEEPGIVGDALAGPDYAGAAYREAADSDLALLEALAPQVLGEAEIALFVAPDCGECAAAVAELRDISKTSGATFTLHDMSDPQARALAQKLGLDDAPFYVLPRMILRGHMPPVVLTRYLSKG